VDYGFLGGAQVDKYGNLNSSFIGDWEKPTVRLPGTGGGNDIASLCKVIVAMHHEKRRLVERVDFVTSPGYLNGGNSKKVMCLEGLQPGASVKAVRDNTGFDLMVKDDLYEAAAPTEEELSILRTLDPEKRYTTPRGD
jgi:glutaconate CoA-transferase subunit B